MATTANEPVVKLDGFKGILNTQRPERLPEGALTSALNVYVDDTGAIETRDGYSVATAGSYLSAYATKTPGLIYLINSSGELSRNNGLVVTSGLTATDDFRWCDDGADNVYLLSQQHQLRITGDTAVPLSVNTPDFAVVTAAGDLPPGVYRITVVAQDAQGRQGAAANPAVVEFTSGGLYVECDSDVLVFVTTANGETFYYVGAGPQQITTPPTGYRLDAAQMSAQGVPDGARYPAIYDNRLCVAVRESDDKSTVFWSEPLWHHLFRIYENYLQVDGEVRHLHAAPQGLLICTDRSVFLFAGDNLSLLSKVGVPPGVSCATSRRSGETWVWTLRGAYRLNAEGFTPATPATSVPPGAVCYAQLIETNGIEQFIVLHDGSGIAYNSYE